MQFRTILGCNATILAAHSRQRTRPDERRIGDETLPSGVSVARVARAIEVEAN